MHARNDHISTSGLKSDVIIVFLHPDSRTFKAYIGLLIFPAWILRTSWPKMRVWRQNRERVVRYWPNELVFSLLFGFLRLCQFRWKSIKKCDRESEHRRTDTQTQTGSIICSMLMLYGADNQWSLKRWNEDYMNRNIKPSYRPCSQLVSTSNAIVWTV